MIADLKLQVRDAHSRLQCYETEIKNQRECIEDLRQQLTVKDRELTEWHRESRENGTEIARLRFDIHQKEEHIADLRSILVQQTELLQLQDYNEGYEAHEYGGERVSAV